MVWTGRRRVILRYKHIYIYFPGTGVFDFMSLITSSPYLTLCFILREIYIIINVVWCAVGQPLDGFGRAMAHWNRLVIKTIMSWELFASRAPHARSARKCASVTI